MHTLNGEQLLSKDEDDNVIDPDSVPYQDWDDDIEWLDDAIQWWNPRFALERIVRGRSDTIHTKAMVLTPDDSPTVALLPCRLPS